MLTLYISVTFLLFIHLFVCVCMCVCVCACVCMVVTADNMICIKTILQEYRWLAVPALVPWIQQKDWGSDSAFIWVLVVLQSAVTSCLNTSTTWWRGPGEEHLCGRCRWCFSFCVRWAASVCMNSYVWVGVPSDSLSGKLSVWIVMCGWVFCVILCLVSCLCLYG